MGVSIVETASSGLHFYLPSTRYYIEAFIKWEYVLTWDVAKISSKGRIPVLLFLVCGFPAVEIVMDVSHPINNPVIRVFIIVVLNVAFSVLMVDISGLPSDVDGFLEILLPILNVVRINFWTNCNMFNCSSSPEQSDNSGVPLFQRQYVYDLSQKCLVSLVVCHSVIDGHSFDIVDTLLPLGKESLVNCETSGVILICRGSM